MGFLRINGVEKHFPDQTPATISELLEQLNVNTATVVAEINGEIIKRENFAKTKLHEDQNIELVRFVGGG